MDMKVDISEKKDQRACSGLAKGKSIWSKPVLTVLSCSKTKGSPPIGGVDGGVGPWGPSK